MRIIRKIDYGTVISSHHRVTQSLTEFYSCDFKLIKLCETLCYSVVNEFITHQKLINSAKALSSQ